MKKIILTITLTVLILALAACGNTTSEPDAANPSTSGDPAVFDGNATVENENGAREFSMPTETLMLLGTIMLEDTDYAVDADQASALLPLWKALRSLGESETSAQAELDAVIAQIEDTMTTEQIGAIEAMELTMQDMGGVAEILGVEISGPGNMTPEMQATMEAARESGEFQRPGGDLPGSGPGGGQGRGGGLGGAEMDPEARETARAERGGVRGAGSGLNPALLEALIEFLEAKVQ